MNSLTYLSQILIKELSITGEMFFAWFKTSKLNGLHFVGKTPVKAGFPSRSQKFVQGGLNFFFNQGGLQHPLGPENSLKSIDFTGPGGSLAPPDYASVPKLVYI